MTVLMEKIIDGVQVNYRACEHCDRLPTEEQMRAAVASAKEDWRPKCSHCGGGYKFKSMDIYHYKEGGSDKWHARASTFEPVVEWYGNGPTPGLYLHYACAKKLFPHANWEEFEKRLRA